MKRILPLRALLVFGIGIVLGQGPLCPAEDEHLCYVQLQEAGGHLAFRTGLPPGHGHFHADDPAGLKLQGFVYVTDEEGQRRARVFRLTGQRAAATDAGAASDAGISAFFINLQATPNPDHYVLHIKITRAIQGQHIEEEARLGHNCCGYSVSATRDGVSLPVGRGHHLSEIMVNVPETYRQFEQLAEFCCRPGFEFVPSSRYSPRVVDEVIAAASAVPAADAAARFGALVAELDSDQFARREAATQALLAQGRSTLWSLARLDNNSLSAEQRHRLRIVHGALQHLEQPALPFAFSRAELQALAADPPADWLQLLRQSPEERVRQWASHQQSLSTSQDDRSAARTIPLSP